LSSKNRTGTSDGKLLVGGILPIILYLRIMVIILIAADLFLLARELLVPCNGFSPILACFVRYSWTYDTERQKHVVGLMGAPIFFIYPMVPTVLYPTAKASN
jgi:hypothetical protein